MVGLDHSPSLHVFHEKADVKADVAAIRFYDQTPTGLASIRTLVGLSFEARCMMVSDRVRCCNLRPGLSQKESVSFRGPRRETQSPELGS